MSRAKRSVGGELRGSAALADEAALFGDGLGNECGRVRVTKRGVAVACSVSVVPFPPYA